MGSLLSLLSVGRDGMLAQTAGLNTTGQNVANVNTPGYVRRSAVLETRALGLGGDGTVLATGIQRSFDRFAYGRVLDEQARQGASDSRASALAQVEATLTSAGGAIASKVNSLFSMLSALSGMPSDSSTRSVVLARAQELAQAISTTSGDLGQMRGDLLNKAQDLVKDVNQRLGRITEFNKQIAIAHGRGDDAADLRDQRGEELSKLSEQVGARAIEDESGRMVVFSAGIAIVDGDQAPSLDVGLDNAGNMQIQAHRPGGSTLDVTTNVTSGELAGLREARDTDISRVGTQLDQFAYDLVTSVNAVHSSGYGLDGATGRPLFAPLAGVQGAAYQVALNPSMVGHPERLAAAESATDLPDGNGVALKLSQLATKPLGGGGPPADRFAGILGDFGAVKESADAEQSLRTDTVAHAKNLYESSSGVSIDEEMANLSRYQRAFEASTRVLRTADELLGDLIKEL